MEEGEELMPCRVCHGRPVLDLYRNRGGRAREEWYSALICSRCGLSVGMRHHVSMREAYKAVCVEWNVMQGGIDGR